MGVKGWAVRELTLASKDTFLRVRFVRCPSIAENLPEEEVRVRNFWMPFSLDDYMSLCSRQE